jgi:tellurite resistance protein TerC
MTVPLWAWAAFVVFVVAMLALDLFVLHRRAHQVSLTEAGAWSAVWVALGLGFGGLLWAWRGGDTAQAYLAGYLIEKSLSLDNVFVFTVIFAMFAIPLRYQHRVLMAGIIGALCLRAAFIAGGAALLHSFHVVVYAFGAVLLWTAIRMLRSGGHLQPGRGLPLVIQRILPTTGQLHGQRFLVREGGRWLATPLLAALIGVEAADVIFAVDSIPAIFAVTTDTFVVFTSNVFALLGLRALYFLLAVVVVMSLWDARARPPTEPHTRPAVAPRRESQSREGQTREGSGPGRERDEAADDHLRPRRGRPQEHQHPHLPRRGGQQRQARGGPGRPGQAPRRRPGDPSLPAGGHHHGVPGGARP